VRFSADDGRRAKHNDARMFGTAYAVWWEGTDGTRCSGRLDLDDEALVLTGTANGCRATETIPFHEIEDVRLEGRRVQVARRSGRSFAIGSLDAPGALRELAERLATPRAVA
jgi:hypothetical protein